MAKYQYRIAGPLDWIASPGSALFAISNPPGSGKKLTIRALEVTNNASIVTNVASILGLSRATVTDGPRTITPEPLDSDASSWPTDVVVSTGGGVSSPGTPIITVQPHKNQVGGLLTGEFARQKPYGIASGGLSKLRPRLGSNDAQSVVVRAGEAVALYPVTYNRSLPLRFHLTLVRSGTPDRTYVVSGYGSILAQNTALVTVNNTSASEVITIRDVKVEEVGTPDTPFFQLVPISGISATALDDETKKIPLMPMDTDYPDGSTWIKAVANTPVYTFGVPDAAFSEGSLGSPKGFNYLQTKDFLGPVYRTFFPEFLSITSRESFNSHGSPKASDLFLRGRGNIVLREGESIALTAAAETAIVTVPVGVSGWASYEVGIVIDVEPSIEPVLSITGLTNPSEVRIFEAGTTTLLAGQENVTSGSFSWVFDPDVNPSVDIAILSLGYQNIRLTSFALSLADVTIPVQQQIDRQYANP